MQPFTQLLKSMVAAHTVLTPVIRVEIGDKHYSMRLFNVIEDLAIVKSWLRDPGKRTNWGLPADFPTIFRYFALLESTQAQSFMVLENGVQLVQLDLKQIAHGLTIDYLYLARHRHPQIFENALLLLTKYVGSFDDAAAHALCLSTHSRETGNEAKRAGFVFVETQSSATGHTWCFAYKS